MTAMQPDPRLAASWCGEGATHDHDASDVAQAPRWPDDRPAGRAGDIKASLDAALGPERPPIVVLCGSTRFYDEFQEANYRLTMEGAIVLSAGFHPHAGAEHGRGEGVGHDEKVALDALHKRKIDLADLVYVLNVGGYVGESTRSEIAYAESIGKPISYLVVGGA
jgi:hypothetical protein